MQGRGCEYLLAPSVDFILDISATVLWHKRTATMYDQRPQYPTTSMLMVIKIIASTQTSNAADALLSILANHSQSLGIMWNGRAGSCLPTSLVQ